MTAGGGPGWWEERPWLLPLVVAVVCGAWKLGRRDFSGDELAILVGNPIEIARNAFDPRGGFSGHLPWSYWLRWGFGLLLGASPVVWRLHAVLGAAVAAITTAIAARTDRSVALVAGLVIAVDPLVVFYAHDGSNYAWSAAAGGMVLAGLVAWRRDAGRWKLLASGLLVGALNDFYFAWVAVGALVWTVLIARRARSWRVGARAWLPAVLVAGPPLLLFAVRSLGVEQAVLVDAHADRAVGAGLGAALEVPWHLVSRASASFLHGTTGARLGEGWEIGPAVLLTLGSLVAGLRRSASDDARVAAVLALAGGACAAGVVIAFRVGLRRTFPVEPRVYIGLLPAVALLWAHGLLGVAGSCRPFSRRVLGGTLLAVVGLGTARELGSLSDMHAWAAETIEAAWRPGDDVVAPEEVSARMRQVTTVSCLPAGVPRARRLWWVRLGDLDQPLETVACSGGRVDLSGWVLARLKGRAPPEQERDAASFLEVVSVALYTRTPPHTERTIRFRDALLSGTEGATVHAELGEAGHETTLLHAPFASRLRLPGGQGLLRVRVLQSVPSWLPRLSLLDPFRLTVQRWDRRILLPVATPLDLRLVPFRAPWLRVICRLLEAALAAVVWGKALHRRSGRADGR